MSEINQGLRASAKDAVPGAAGRKKAPRSARPRGADAPGGAPASEDIVAVLPYLRRYARALTGSQERGDRYVRQFLQVILHDPALVGADDLKLQVFKVFHSVCSGLDVGDDVAPPEQPDLQQEIEAKIAGLPPLSRRILLLVSLEGFPVAKTAQIVELPEADVRELLLAARLELQRQVGARVMIIEDDAVIAMEIAVVVRSTGHTVVGVADTVATARALAEEQQPDLILSDIQLKDGDSGLDAVEQILRTMTVPVIVITGFPEALLTGQKVEPAFVITKPFDPETLTTAIGQALATR